MKKLITRIPVKVDEHVFPAGTAVVGLNSSTPLRVVIFPNGAVASVKMHLELEEVQEPFDFNALQPLG